MSYGAVALLGAGGLAWNQYKGLQEQANKLGEKPPQNELAEMFANGTAKMQLIINPDKKDYTILKYASLLALAGVPIYLISRLLNKMSLKGKTKYANELKLLRHLSKNSNRQLKAFTNPRKTRRFAKLRQQLKEHKKLTRRKFQKYQKERKLYVQQIKKARAIQKHNRIIRARIQAKRKLAREKLAQHLKWSKRFNYAKRGGLLAIGAAFVTSLFDKDVRNSTIGSIDAGLAGAFIGGALGGTKGAMLGGAIGAGASELLQTNDAKASQALASEMKQEAEMQKDDSLAGLVLDSPSKKQTETQQYKASHADEQSKKQSKQFNQYVNYKKAETEAYNKAKEMEIQRKSIDDSSEMINATNDLYSQEKRQSLESHGIQWGQVATHEKQIWQTNYENFLAVYQDRKMALEMATKALITCKSMGGGNGMIYANASAVEFGNACYAKAPADIKSWIDEASSKWNVPKWLIAGVLQIETGMNKNPAHSSAGAIGIAQFMPETAAGFGFDPNDPHASILGAAHYLRNLLNMYGGSTFKTVLAYNMGHYSDDWRNYPEQVDYVRKFHMIDSNNNPVDENEQTAGYVPVATSPSASSNGQEISGNTGVDPRYVVWSGLAGNGNDLGGMTSQAKQKLNAMSKLYFEQTGQKLRYNIATGGEHPSNASPWGHSSGWKIDLAYDVNQQALIKAANAVGAAVGHEDAGGGNEHYDVSFGQGGVGGTVITQNPTGNGSGGGGGANPKLNINLDDIKPKTLKEQWDDSWKAYKKAVHNGKENHGALVNGVYIDTSKPYQSIEEIGKEIREKNRKQWGDICILSFPHES